MVVFHRFLYVSQMVTQNLLPNGHLDGEDDELWDVGVTYFQAPFSPWIFSFADKHGSKRYGYKPMTKTPGLKPHEWGLKPHEWGLSTTYPIIARDPWALWIKTRNAVFLYWLVKNGFPSSWIVAIPNYIILDYITPNRPTGVLNTARISWTRSLSISAPSLLKSHSPVSNPSDGHFYLKVRPGWQVVHNQDFSSPISSSSDPVRPVETTLKCSQFMIVDPHFPMIFPWFSHDFPHIKAMSRRTPRALRPLRASARPRRRLWSRGPPGRDDPAGWWCLRAMAISAVKGPSTGGG